MANHLRPRSCRLEILLPCGLGSQANILQSQPKRGPTDGIVDLVPNVPLVQFDGRVYTSHPIVRARTWTVRWGYLEDALVPVRLDGSVVEQDTRVAVDNLADHPA